MRKLVSVLAMMAVAAAVHAVEVDPALPAYEPQALAASAVASHADTSLFGYNDMRELLEPLAARFSASHGGLKVGLDLPGTRLAPAALAVGRAALAPMGAEMTPPQLAAYLADTGGVAPIMFRVAHASLDPRALSGPLGVFVRADNPIPALTLAQLSQVFSGQLTRWGELGARDEWKDRPIHLYGVQLGSALAYAMQDALQGDARFGTTMRGLPQSGEVVERVSQDALGLGYAAAMRSTAAVRLVPLARRAGDEPLLPSLEAILGGRYPLDRHLLIYARRPLTPFAREFMRLMLSREGQQAVAATPQHYLPLSAAEAAVERAKLELPP